MIDHFQIDTCSVDVVLCMHGQQKILLQKTNQLLVPSLNSSRHFLRSSCHFIVTQLQVTIDAYQCQCGKLHFLAERRIFSPETVQLPTCLDGAGIVTPELQRQDPDLVHVEMEDIGSHFHHRAGSL